MKASLSLFYVLMENCLLIKYCAQFYSNLMQCDLELCLLFVVVMAKTIFCCYRACSIVHCSSCNKKQQFCNKSIYSDKFTVPSVGPERFKEEILESFYPFHHMVTACGGGN